MRYSFGHFPVEFSAHAIAAELAEVIVSVQQVEGHEKRLTLQHDDVLSSVTSR